MGIIISDLLTYAPPPKESPKSIEFPTLNKIKEHQIKLPIMPDGSNILIVTKNGEQFGHTYRIDNPPQYDNILAFYIIFRTLNNEFIYIFSENWPQNRFKEDTFDNIKYIYMPTYNLKNNTKLIEIDENGNGKYICSSY